MKKEIRAYLITKAATKQKTMEELDKLTDDEWIEIAERHGMISISSLNVFAREFNGGLHNQKEMAVRFIEVNNYN